MLNCAKLLRTTKDVSYLIPVSLLSKVKTLHLYGLCLFHNFWASSNIQVKGQIVMSKGQNFIFRWTLCLFRDYILTKPWLLKIFGLALLLIYHILLFLHCDPKYVCLSVSPLIEMKTVAHMIFRPSTLICSYKCSARSDLLVITHFFLYFFLSFKLLVHVSGFVIMWFEYVPSTLVLLMWF